jgi:hypothetical protein
MGSAIVVVVALLLHYESLRIELAKRCHAGKVNPGWQCTLRQARLVF